MDAPITVDWRESAAHDACGSAVGRLSPLATVLARNFHDYGRGANWLDQATGGARHTRTSFSGPRAPGVGGARKGRAQHALHPARQRRRPEHRGARWTQKTLVTGFTGCWRRWTSVRACVGHCVCSRARQVRPSPYCVKVRALAAGRACPRTDAAISALGSSEVTLPPSRRVGWLLEASRGGCRRRPPHRSRLTTCMWMLVRPTLLSRPSVRPIARGWGTCWVAVGCLRLAGKRRGLWRHLWKERSGPMRTRQVQPIRRCPGWTRRIVAGHGWGL